jgi:hypothetical protein
MAKSGFYEKYISRKPALLPHEKDKNCKTLVLSNNDIFKDINSSIEVTTICDETIIGDPEKCHQHPYEEYYIFKGLDAYNPWELDCEIEFWLGQGSETERIKLNTTSVVYIPPNLAHLPIHINKLRKPVEFYKWAPYAPSFQPETVKRTPSGKSTDPTWKYEKYISRHQNLFMKAYAPERAHAMHPAPFIYTNKDIIKGTDSFVEVSTVWADVGFGLPNGCHYHAYPEIFVFKGLDAEHPEELGGEIEWWLGEGDRTEKVVLNTSSVVYVPGNLMHFPMFMRNMKKPIEWFVFAPGGPSSEPIFTKREDNWQEKYGGPARKV